MVIMSNGAFSDIYSGMHQKLIARLRNCIKQESVNAEL